MLEINKIYNEDCLEGMKKIDDKSIDMILCDLPYGTTSCKWDSIIPFEPLWEQYNRIIKDNGAIVLTATQPFATKLISSNLNMFRYELIWDKISTGGFLIAKKKPLPRHENILLFYKRLPTYNPEMTDADPKNIRMSAKHAHTNNCFNIKSGMKTCDSDPDKRYPTSILKYSCRASECNNTKRIHPTQKPVALFEYLIKTYTNEGELILDNCIGSGTSAIAAINTTRNYIGFELDKTYYDLACERIDKHIKSRME